jgi:hypothetical protein
MIKDKFSIIKNLYKIYLNGCLVLILFFSVCGFKNNDIKQSKLLITTEARIAVEKAWDTYHDGALGVTLKSPDIQTELETKLHLCRELLAEAYEAEDKGNAEKTKNLISKIIMLSNNVITESQVPKK